MTVPVLSVIMPVYNGAATLSEALSSIETQGLDIEIISVDQASSDNSRQILEDWQSRLPLRIIDAPDSTAWTTTTNIGLAEARAPILTMLHQDDAWRPDFATSVCTLAQEFPKAPLLLHSAAFMDNRGRRFGRFAPPLGGRRRLVSSSEMIERLLVQNTIALPAAAFRRDDVEASGGLEPSLWYTADWDLWLRLAARGPIAWEPREIADFRVHIGSQTMVGSRDLEAFERQLAEPIERHGNLLEADQRTKVLALAEASKSLNIYLAARYQNKREYSTKFLYQFMKLGPTGWLTFIRYSRIFQRVIPRLRLSISNKKMKT